MNTYLEKKEKRNKMKDRQQRIRYKMKKVSSRKRLSVFRSNNHLYAQLIDDINGVTLASSSSTEKSIKEKKLSKKEIAELIGKNIAKKIISQGINKVAFDRGKYKYHGLIKILAESARVEGLNF
tara:strand:- start:1668 stop:2039 length:372 start_codon:yes stop_codon:yes gene_type:complete